MIDQPTGAARLAPPPAASAPPHVPPPPRPMPQGRAGQLTAGWQIMVGATWAAVFFAYAATWKVSEEIGIGTWWLGARSQPQPLLVSLLPFILAVVVTFAAIYNVPRVAAISLIGSVALALVATFDIDRSGGLAAIEFAIAAAAAIVSVAAFTGTYRSASPSGGRGAGGDPDTG